jgi:small subunit ribosomal protein S17
MATKPDQDPAPEENAQPSAGEPLDGGSHGGATAEGQDAPPEASAGPGPEAPAEAEPAGAASEAPAGAEPDLAAPAEPEAEAPAASQTQAPPESQPPAPAEEGSAKERRRRARSRHVGAPRPSRSPEQRHAERLAERRAKAARRRARRLQEGAKARRRATQAPAGAATASEPELAPVHAAAGGKRKVRQGIVVSDRAEKTIVVRIDVARRHRRYEKIVRSSSTLHAHDENNDAREGDMVRVIESRPLSRTKRWRLVEVLERAQ